jgi:MFS family permease
MTDLPLVFAIAFITQAFNILILTLPNVGLLQPSMILFRMRTILIGGSVVPILGALLQIWVPSTERYHNRLVLVFTLYWVSVALLGPTEEIVMVMCIPLMLILGVMMMLTFIVTWRTGRLKEVRSDLMIISVLLGMASQVLRVPLMSTGLFYVPDVLLMLSMLVTAVAFANPWYKRDHKVRYRESSEYPLYSSIES